MRITKTRPRFDCRHLTFFFPGGDLVLPSTIGRDRKRVTLCPLPAALVPGCNPVSFHARWKFGGDLIRFNRQMRLRFHNWRSGHFENSDKCSRVTVKVRGKNVKAVHPRAISRSPNRIGRETMVTHGVTPLSSVNDREGLSGSPL